MPDEETTEDWIKASTPQIVALFYAQLQGFVDQIVDQATMMLEGTIPLNAQRLRTMTAAVLGHPVWQDCELMIELLLKIQVEGKTVTEQQESAAAEALWLADWIEQRFAKTYASELRDIDQIRAEMRDRVMKDVGKPQLYVPGMN